LIITAKYWVTITKWQLLRPLCIQCVNPPMLRVWRCAAEIETPARIGRQDHGALQGSGAEGLATHLTDRLEVDAVPRLSDDDTDSTTRVDGSPKTVREPEDTVD
jgi:hypothetical protein